MRVVIEFTEANDPLGRLTRLPEYRTIDTVALVDCIIGQYDPYGDNTREEILTLCLDSISAVDDYGDCPEYFEKMVKDISDLILCIFNKLSEHGLDRVIESGYVKTRIVKQWRNVYVIDFTE